MIKIKFPDGSVREYNEGVNGLQIAESISSRLAQDVLACGVNGETYLIQRGVDVEVPKAIAEVLRHSEEMDNAAAEKIAAAEAAAVQQAQRV